MKPKIWLKNIQIFGTDFLILAKELKKDPLVGESLGNNIFKLRIAITDKGRGRSGSARVIIHVKIVDKVVYVLSTYDKAEYDTVIKSVLKDMISKL